MRLVLLLALSLALPVRAADLPGRALDGPWRLVGFDGLAEPAVTIDGCGVALSGRGVVGIVYRVLAEGVPTERLSWRWRVTSGPGATDLARRGGEDRAIAVHVWYPAGDEGFLAGLGRRLAGLPAVGRAVSYVWGGDRPAGTILDNPFLDDAVQIVVEPAGTGGWRRVTADVAADYRRAFGEAPPSRPRFLAVSGDTDDTGGFLDVAVADLAFEGGPDCS